MDLNYNNKFYLIINNIVYNITLKNEILIIYKYLFL